ncbi:hypothetical protein INT80_05435 [Gallibacterium anatis]|uniref:Uncharacterized protein n=1 Tax=Gallibacterium anatis TaxID=750 RepID=A0A930UW42_9PAST|nr:hypothetical protein [Gallibacterium anatis]
MNAKHRHLEVKKIEEAEDILYKLETLKDYGGLMTKNALIAILRFLKQL